MSSAASEPFCSSLWSAAESGDAATVTSLMAAGSTLHADEWSELSDFGNTDMLLAVLKGGFRPSAEQLAQTLIDAASFGGSEETALQHTTFWLDAAENVLGQATCQAMAQRCGAAMCLAARRSCLKDGETNLDASKPTPPLLALVQAWTTKHGGTAQ